MKAQTVGPTASHSCKCQRKFASGSHNVSRIDCKAPQHRPRASTKVLVCICKTQINRERADHVYTLCASARPSASATGCRIILITIGGACTGCGSSTVAACLENTLVQGTSEVFWRRCCPLEPREEEASCTILLSKGEAIEPTVAKCGKACICTCCCPLFALTH